MKRAFDAVERARISRPDGSVLHAQVSIADSLLMIGEPQGQWKARASMLYLYVRDIDAVYKQAIAAGAIALDLAARLGTDVVAAVPGAALYGPCGVSPRAGGRVG